jgi:hypothetical protein
MRSNSPPAVIPSHANSYQSAEQEWTLAESSSAPFEEDHGLKESSELSPNGKSQKAPSAELSGFRSQRICLMPQQQIRI